MTSEIAKIRELLPMYVIGRLTEAEASEVEIALKMHPELNAELAEFREVENAYRELEKEMDSPPDTVPDAVLDQIRNAQKRRPDGILQPDRNWGFRDLFEKIFSSSKIAWSLAAAQLIFIVFLMAGGPSERRYVTLTAPTGSHGSEIRIQIEFVETATEGEIRALLIDLNASILSGPTLQGIYTIRLKAGSDGQFEMEMLKRSPLVRSARKAVS